MQNMITTISILTSMPYIVSPNLIGYSLTHAGSSTFSPHRLRAYT
jgi:hypothetical protein